MFSLSSDLLPRSDYNLLLCFLFSVALSTYLL